MCSNNSFELQVRRLLACSSVTGVSAKRVHYRRTRVTYRHAAYSAELSEALRPLDLSELSPTVYCMLGGIMAAAYHLHGRMMVVEIQVGCAAEAFASPLSHLSGVLSAKFFWNGGFDVSGPTACLLGSWLLPTTCMAG